MSHYQNAYVPGGSFFFTVVTERRAPIFCTDTYTPDGAFASFEAFKLATDNTKR